MSFNNVTMFTYSSDQMMVDVSSSEIELALTTIDASIVADAPLADNVSRAKLLIDGLVVQPIIESFTNDDIRDGLYNAYGYSTTEYVETLASRLAQSRVHKSTVESTSNALMHAAVTKLSTNQITAQTASLAVMDELASRRYLLDDVADNVYEDIRSSIANIIAETYLAK